MRKVAIVTAYDIYEEDYTNHIIRSITDWDEVTDEEFELLDKALKFTDKRLVERFALTEEFKENTINGYLKKLEKEKKEKERLEKEYKMKAEERKRKREEKKILKEKEEYEKLRQKFEKDNFNQSDGLVTN